MRTGIPLVGIANPDWTQNQNMSPRLQPEPEPDGSGSLDGSHEVFEGLVCPEQFIAERLTPVCPHLSSMYLPLSQAGLDSPVVTE